ncbi:1-phosphatidylinositol 4,5-bisphosphate phosphodiesterase delta-4 [Tachysurus vachellii]|uniref:1-phosphatidylinositol 4,5-bisphosphate phosphodiesterase delta-4 n=1 Tax=Tachysurus vachellii TaxID=175792 RepID=UPI00296AF06C|nr:1-phosphatidylinositol 4,5-bisphosphate phosphodiesterase delta-4 [Tachysurus vachellii]
MECPQKDCFQSNANLDIMKAGSVLRKATSRIWKGQRQYKLQDDCKTVMYKSSWTISSYSTFSVGDVEAVREGHQSEVFLSMPDEFPPECCFTLVFRGRRGNLDLVASSAEEAQAWIQGMQMLIENLQNMDECEKLDHWVSDLFMRADKNKDGRISFKEVQKLLKLMNIDMNELHAHSLFMMSDMSQTGMLDAEEFVHFYKMLTQRKEILELFQEYSSNGQALSHCDLEEFLREEQLEGETSYEHALELIQLYEPSDTAKTQHIMSADGFLMYLISAEGSIFNTEHQRLYQDMTQPLNHYFISSSHNTYLLDDQLKGRSSVEAYIKALKRGCRCVEVDCWDGPNGEPIVYHGHTFTSKILFKDVVSTVAKYAFEASEYPLILTIENHCSIEQQTVMAELLKNILGDMLLKTTIDGKVPSVLPSPEELKGKILLKGKKTGELEECSDADNLESSDVSDDDKAVDKDNQATESRKSKKNLSKELSDLVIYCKNVHFNSFEYSRNHSKPYEMSSFSESKARKLIKEAGADFIQHNRRHLSRVYPSGLRTDSSNYCPHEMWNMGCQIVALNVQTAGLEMDLNDGMFSQNNCCGYVLKPEILRNSEHFDPEWPDNRKDYCPLSLTIQVISGQQLPKVSKKEWSIVDPLVRVEIYGVPLDQTQQETKHIENNGFNPYWNETLQFVVHTPELAIVRFVVEDYDMASKNDFIGQYALPFSCIQPGYRHIHLLSKDGTSICPSSLFVHITIKKAS